MEIDRRAFIASLGGAAAVNLMDHEAKAEALEHYMEEKLDEMVAAQQPEKFPTVAEIEAQIETRNFRRGAGGLFASGRGNVQKLPPIKPDHGWWGAQLFEPYIPEKSAFAIRYHQTLRFYPDEDAGYEYPDQYYRIFGHDYTPPAYIEQTYKMLKNHKWYMEPRLVTVNDLYAFDPNAKVSFDPFEDIVGRHFKQPKEGLGFDNSPSAHMW